MHTILIANPKGGSGKTTLATNVAGWLAGKRQRVAIDDRDPQQSSTQWLERRPALFPAIGLIDVDLRRKDAKALDLAWRVIDSPAGLHGDELRESLKSADQVLVPLTPSAYDMAATQRFLGVVAEAKSVKQGNLPVGVVAMRVDARTQSAVELDDFVASFDFPLIAHLRSLSARCARGSREIAM